MINVTMILLASKPGLRSFCRFRGANLSVIDAWTWFSFISNCVRVSSALVTFFLRSSILSIFPQIEPKLTAIVMANTWGLGHASEQAIASELSEEQ